MPADPIAEQVAGKHVGDAETTGYAMQPSVQRRI